ncbi:MAG: hypothetical protein PWQ33_1979 [Pseudothermotoga sp.]|nr:hypothetical protein [Pseudothermotoga sp.]
MNLCFNRTLEGWKLVFGGRIANFAVRFNRTLEGWKHEDELVMIDEAIEFQSNLRGMETYLKNLMHLDPILVSIEP